jgi:predicted transposase YdaD
MRRDLIFREGSDQYRFESVAVKEPKFEIDGVLIASVGQGLRASTYFLECCSGCIILE